MVRPRPKVVRAAEALGHIFDDAIAIDKRGVIFLGANLSRAVLELLLLNKGPYVYAAGTKDRSKLKVWLKDRVALRGEIGVARKARLCQNIDCRDRPSVIVKRPVVKGVTTRDLIEALNKNLGKVHSIRVRIPVILLEVYIRQVSQAVRKRHTKVVVGDVKRA
jgi:hypothetical protein